MFNTETSSLPTFATVAITQPVGPQGVLTYRIPAELREQAVPGVRVLVPLGQRKTTGIIAQTISVEELSDEAPTLAKVKDILDILDATPLFGEDILQLWRWVAGYYFVSPAEVLSLILPSGLRSESSVMVKLHKEKAKNKRRKTKGKSHDSTEMQSESEEDKLPLSANLSTMEADLLRLLAEKKRLSTKTLRQHFSSSSLSRILTKLETLGFITVGERISPRRAVTLVEHEPSSEENRTHEGLAAGGEEKDARTRLGTVGDRLGFFLSAAQESACQQIGISMDRAAFRVFLLHGVTGSGKTEVYLRAAQKAVALDKSVLFLVPEIALTHQLIERVQQRFGAQVAVLHSGQTMRSRWQDWQRIAHGQAKVVIGVRSAVFAPVPRLGLIVVDEEHDTAYKQEDGVRYNARDIAVLRGKLVSCPVILGSATPSLETHVHSRTERYTLLELPERIESRPMPTVEIVDLRQDARTGNADKIFSTPLRQALLATYEAGKQSVLFLNRRGYANYLQCRYCGEVLSCRQCSVALTFHLNGNLLRCHYCGFSRQAPVVCPQCNESALAGCGMGTEQVEEAVTALLAGVRVARLDRDSVSRRGALAHTLTAWQRQELDVLIGTQMVTKGHDVPGVTLVGVLLADVSLNFPDFRAAERTFQLLTQVAGRAGRGQERGRVIIQTYVPHHYSIRCAARHDYARFATQELRYRKSLGYPPFAHVVNVRVDGRVAEQVKGCAEDIAHVLWQSQGHDSRESINAPTDLSSAMPTILGPAPAPIERLNGRERWQILLKGKDRGALHTLVRHIQADVRAQKRDPGVRIVIDVDPYNML